MQKTRVHKCKPGSWEGCQVFHERLGCIRELSQPALESLNASTITPGLLCRWQRFTLSRNFFGLHSEPPRKTVFATKYLRTLSSCAKVVPHLTWCRTLWSYKHYITIFGNEMEYVVHQTIFCHRVTEGTNSLRTRLGGGHLVPDFFCGLTYFCLSLSRNW